MQASAGDNAKIAMRKALTPDQQVSNSVFSNEFRRRWKRAVKKVYILAQKELEGGDDVDDEKVRQSEERRTGGAKRQQCTAHSFNWQPFPRSLRWRPTSQPIRDSLRSSQDEAKEAEDAEKAALGEDEKDGEEQKEEEDGKGGKGREDIIDEEDIEGVDLEEAIRMTEKTFEVSSGKWRNFLYKYGIHDIEKMLEEVRPSEEQRTAGRRTGAKDGWGEATAQELYRLPTQLIILPLIASLRSSQDEDRLKEKKAELETEKMAEAKRAYEGFVRKKDMIRIRLPDEPERVVGGHWKPPRMDFSKNGVVRKKQTAIPLNTVQMMRGSGLRYVHALGKGKNGLDADLERGQKGMIKTGFVHKENFKPDSDSDADDDAYENEKRNNKAARIKRAADKSRKEGCKKSFDLWRVKKELSERAIKVRGGEDGRNEATTVYCHRFCHRYAPPVYFFSTIINNLPLVASPVTCSLSTP